MTSPRAIASPPPGSRGHLGGGMVRCVAASFETQPRQEPMMSNVQVKPLEWECIGWSSGDGIKGENDDTWEAVVHGAQDLAYRIDWLGGGVFLTSDLDNRDFRCDSLAAAKAAAQADYEQRIRSALVPAPAVPDDVEAWRDDPAADDRWNAGCDFAMTQLCKVLNVDPQAVSWDAATEELEGDVRVVIGNIITAAFGDDWPTPTTIKAQAAELARLREVLENEAYEFSERHEVSGFYVARRIRAALTHPTGEPT